MHTIAIIGSGPTGIYTAQYLLASGENLSITVFEQQAEAGKGTPYHQDWNDEEMLSNIASIELPPVSETLVHWLCGQSDHELTRFGIAREDITGRTFFPRVALGEYFKAQLKKLVLAAPASGNTLTVKTLHKVLDVKRVEEGFSLTVQHNSTVSYPVFDYVVMATGHAWPKQPEIKPGYFLSPWPASCLGTIGNCPVGIRGTSLTAIDATVALSVARGSFYEDATGMLQYASEPGTDAFHVTMMSRKGVLPEADFFYPLPYTALTICTKEAIDRLIATSPRAQLLEAVFSLFKAELMHSDPAYASNIQLKQLTLEQFSQAYFEPREQAEPFVWAEKNLGEAKENQARRYTVPWRYAILRMHEVIARIVPRLAAEDYKRFNQYFKPVFVDNYATIPHTSIERLLALHRAGKLDIISLGNDYKLDTQSAEQGAILRYNAKQMHFPAFVEAIGQRPLSIHEFPFKSLWTQGLIEQARVDYDTSERFKKPIDIGGIELDDAFHPVSHSSHTFRLYCLSLPFMLGQFPFAQGITSSHEMGRKVAHDMIRNITHENRLPAPVIAHTESAFP